MISRTTDIRGLIIIEPKVHADHRGYFFESFHQENCLRTGIHETFVQDNESKSAKGVVRGLHYQMEPFAQAKLVRVIEGEVFDVAVDLRKGSPTFGKWFGICLNGTNKLQLFIPEGFAHGFSVLSETAVFSYKCSKYYNQASERGIRFDDPSLAIDWRIPLNEQSSSEKDRNAPLFIDAEMNFIYNL
jgi:dTDP-4-dehydrorhamnose 3,5-epimerase